MEGHITLLINKLQAKHGMVYFVVREGKLYFVPDHHRYLRPETEGKRKLVCDINESNKFYYFTEPIENQIQIKNNLNQTIMKTNFKKGDKVIRFTPGSSMGRPGVVTEVTGKTLSIQWESGITSSEVDPGKTALASEHPDRIKEYRERTGSGGAKKVVKKAPKKEVKKAPKTTAPATPKKEVKKAPSKPSTPTKPVAKAASAAKSTKGGKGKGEDKAKGSSGYQRPSGPIIAVIPEDKEEN